MRAEQWVDGEAVLGRSLVVHVDHQLCVGCDLVKCGPLVVIGHSVRGSSVRGDRCPERRVVPIVAASLTRGQVQHQRPATAVRGHVAVGIERSKPA
jgi:hypothetical protein